MKSIEQDSAFKQFLNTVRALRGPGGCPWDIEQTHQTLIPFAIEETYELVDAIDSNKNDMIKEELGDVLLQVVLHSVIAEQRGAFSIEDVLQSINEKMIRRHPHVFNRNSAENAGISNADSAINHFLSQKEKEKANAPQKTDLGLPRGLPALQKAQKIGDKSKRIGFDWLEAKAVLDKVKEELQELELEIFASETKEDRLTDELGDVLFTVAQLGRHLKLNSEQALQAANRKFEKRLFKMLEIGKITIEEFAKLTPDQKEALWNKAKLQL